MSKQKKHHLCGTNSNAITVDCGPDRRNPTLQSSGETNQFGGITITGMESLIVQEMFEQWGKAWLLRGGKFIQYFASGNSGYKIKQHNKPAV